MGPLLSTLSTDGARSVLRVVLSPMLSGVIIDLPQRDRQRRALVVAGRQHGVLRRGQLTALGIAREFIAGEVAARRWQTVGPVVVVLHNGPMTEEQLRWAAVLNAGPRAALAGSTAAELYGLQGWSDDRINVVVPRGSTPPMTELPVKLHESRRFDPYRDIHPLRQIPTVKRDRSFIDAAAWSRSPRRASGLLVAAVQQRLTTPQLLLAELTAAGIVRHRRILHAVLHDAGGGAQALSEVDFGGLCRRTGLPAPVRQVVRQDPDGRKRYIDAELKSRSGKRVLVEIDGALHLVPTTYWSDMARANELVISGSSVLRFPTIALYLDEAVVVDQLRRMLDR